ncbi:MAG TPA: S9 family peptidase [Steroidobacteraceae bacterium]|nr:S9 family peptidase [Steroidobacteraceae bacterium]
MRTEGDSRIVVIATVADRKMIRWIKAADEKLRNLEWADDDNVMITTSVTDSVRGFKDEWSMLRVYSVSKNEVRSLPGKPLEMESDDRVMNTVIGEVRVRYIDGHTVLFVPGIHLNQGVTLFRCDLTTRATNVVRVGDSDTSTWLVDAKGQLAAEQDYDEQTQRWSIRLFRDGTQHQTVSGQAALDAPSVLGFGSTGDTLLVESVENGSRTWKTLSMNEGKFSAPMGDGDVFDSALNDPLTDRLVGGINLVDVPEYVFLDPALENHWKSVVKAFDGDNVQYVSASRDHSRIVVLVQGPKHGYRYELIDLEKAAAVPIGKVYAGIDNALEVQRITYAAADGLKIPAYLTLPRDRPARNLPLIVLPHGGPAARDTAEFDWWSQALAEQGYAVLRPNYRGSNLDVAFLHAGFGQWGRKMQTDLSDGVRYLAKEGIVDASRVCIVGGSYGGYAALAGITLDASVYRCAVSVAGISDLAAMLKWESRGGIDARSVTRYWDRFWGVSGALDPALNAISPIRHVDAIKAPLLLIHGRDDTVVPFEQSQMMFDALKKDKRDVEMVVLKKEDHWLSHGETRMQMLEATVAFLRAHNPPD